MTHNKHPHFFPIRCKIKMIIYLSLQVIHGMENYFNVLKMLFLLNNKNKNYLDLYISFS